MPLLFCFLYMFHISHYICAVLLWFGVMLYKFTLNCSLYYFQHHYFNNFQSCLISPELLIGSQKWDLNVSINHDSPLFQNYHCQFSFSILFSVSQVCRVHTLIPYLLNFVCIMFYSHYLYLATYSSLFYVSPLG